MTTTATTDTSATVAQIVRLVEAGCEIVRIPVGGPQDVRSVPEIRKALRSHGVRVPLVADVRASLEVAMSVLEHVDEIRIHPIQLTEAPEVVSTERMDRIATVFSPLVKRAKNLGVAMRVGVDQKSLPGWIVGRFRDTPEGMVACAIELVRLCED